MLGQRSEAYNSRSRYGSLLSATGSLAHRITIPGIFSFATKYALLKITHEFSHIYSYENIYWLSRGTAFCNMKL